MEPRYDELEADDLAEERDPDEVDDDLWPGEAVIAPATTSLKTTTSASA